MPYRPINLVDYDKVDVKLIAILDLAQKKYENVIGYSREDIVIEEIPKKNNISKKVMNFLFEPKYDNPLKIFPRKKTQS